MTKIIYVAGLYHTGSTLLDLTLGGHSKIIGFGEVYKTAKDGPEEQCTCGKAPHDCLFWSQVLAAKNNSHHEEFYNTFLRVARSMYGEELVILDSSKCSPFRAFDWKSAATYRGLDFWVKADVKLAVVHLTRDPRSWVAALRRRDKRMRSSGEESLMQRIKHMELFRYAQWLVGHRRIERYLKAMNIPHVRFSYEEFCEDPKTCLSSATSLFQLEYEESMLKLRQSSSHICVGNPARLESATNREIQYDTRWIEAGESCFGTIFAKMFSRRIREIVYGNQ